MRKLGRAMVLATLIAATACGGGGLSKQEYIAQADKICREMDERLRAVTEPESLEQLGAYTKQVLPLLEQAVGRLRALEPPADDAATIDGMLDKYDEGVDVTEEMANAAAAGDEAAVGQALQRLQDVTNEGQRIAESYGFKDCAEE